MAFPEGFNLSKTGGSGTSRYTMFHLRENGEVKIRVLSEFIAGQSVWGEPNGERICTRVRIGESIPTKAIGTNSFSGLPERIKDFVAAIVWNYDTEQLEIFETDKATIIEQIMNYEADSDYGDSRGYDLKLKKSGEKKETTYSVVALPPKDPDKTILEAYNKHSINLEALYDGEDPFKEDLPF